MKKIYVSEYSTDDKAVARGEFGPAFLKTTWPAVLLAIDVQAPVFVVQNEATSNTVFEAIIQDFKKSGGRLLMNGLYQVPAMAHSCDDIIETLKYLSYYNGHLNVFFVLSRNDAHVQKLVRLWPKVEEYVLGSENNMGFIDWTSFAMRIAQIIDKGALLGFGHDGAPLYILRTQQMTSGLEGVLPKG